MANNRLFKSIQEDKFKARGWKWRIVLYPSGHKADGYASIFLEFADLKSVPSGWHTCVQFALVLWNPKDPTQYIVHRMYKIKFLSFFVS